MGTPVRYHVDLSARRQHLVRVTLQVPDDVGPGARLVMATWTPGSYVMRDYVHHLQSITARNADGDVALELDGHTAWRVPADVSGPFEVSYELYANELTVRTNHVDDHHALLVAPATFVFVDGERGRRHVVEVDAGGDPVWSLLPDGESRGEAAGTFVADDLDHLIDSAFEVGDHPHTTAEVRGVPHRFVWTGHGGRPDLDALATDMADIGEAAVDLFDGDLPVDAYTFLTVGWDAGGGGLEHRDGSVLMMPVTTFQDADSYARLQSLIAHEYLHLWNVKRLTPAELVRPDLVAHTHTRLLWVAEGWTAYYDELLPLRAGRWTMARYLKALADQSDRVRWRPGIDLQSVEEASHTAWTKLYIRDENWGNAGTDYYAHGAVLAWCLDLLIRRERPDGDGLDEAFRALWREHARTADGYTDADVRAATSAAAGVDLGWFFDAHVRGRALPDVEALVDAVGLRFTRPVPEGGDVPHLGVEVTDADAGVTLSTVARGGPAWDAGVTGGDTLLAVHGQSVGRGQLPTVLRGRAAGDEVVLTVRRGPRVLSLTTRLGEPRRPSVLVAVDEPTQAQQAAFRSWTGQDLDSLPAPEDQSGTPG